MAWISVKYVQNTIQDKLGSIVATFEHPTLGVFTYQEDRIDMVSGCGEFILRAKVALQAWEDSQVKYDIDELSILSELNQQTEEI